ncbi:MAG: hypothetical protein LBI20_02050 [Holosporales bacterium]|nr:hypothetical protein [Holosporales bacterium]
MMKIIKLTPMVTALSGIYFCQQLAHCSSLVALPESTLDLSSGFSGMQVMSLGDRSISRDPEMIAMSPYFRIGGNVGIGPVSTDQQNAVAQRSILPSQLSTSEPVAFTSDENSASTHSVRARPMNQTQLPQSSHKKHSSSAGGIYSFVSNVGTIGFGVLSTYTAARNVIDYAVDKVSIDVLRFVKKNRSVILATAAGVALLDGSL